MCGNHSTKIKENFRYREKFSENYKDFPTYGSILHLEKVLLT